MGAGIGGSTAAYFLREELGSSVQMDIFEVKEVGGRTQIWQDGDEVYEMGASIIHEQNRYFRELADKMGLERVQLGSDGDQVSIWDGHSFVFNQSSWTLVNLYRMVRRYGLSYFYMRSAPSEMLKRYKRLYDIQAEGRAFDTPEELLGAVDLYNLTQQTFRDVLLEEIGLGPAAERFAGEFVAGINRIQYNQGNGINALAGMVSLLPTIDSRLFHIKGGNRLLAERLINATGANLLLGRRVTAVHKGAQGGFQVHSRRADAPKEEGEWHSYDAVLLAGPLELANIGIGGFEHKKPPLREFQQTVTTLVQGRLRPSYFGVRELPTGEFIMVTENSTAPFSSIAPQRELPSGLKVYKLFSRQPLWSGTLQEIFQNLTVLEDRSWLAYPHFSPPERFQPFKLTEGLYLNNAWENAASAMEMSAVAAKNCALLIAQHLSKSHACSSRGPSVSGTSGAAESIGASEE
ncbi:g7913 [Coccomyxa viridis]|uniref:G7913 protein n=1 Tax=Coccomyxa viridis TaxID=1274662 RepID=A0ABP1G343_9CHLO